MSARVAVALGVVLVVVLIVALAATRSPQASPAPTRSGAIQSPTISSSPSVTPSPTRVDATSPTATSTAAASAASGFCANSYLTGETPLVPPRKSGTFAEVALDAVSVGPGPFGTTTRWRVRAFNPTGSPGTLELALRAQVRTSAGADLPILGYESGPPNAEAVRTTEPVVVDPCDPNAVPGTRQRGKLVLVVHTAPITTGSYVLTVRDAKTPEGSTRDEVWNLTLSCVTDPGPAGGLNCRAS